MIRNGLSTTAGGFGAVDAVAGGVVADLVELDKQTVMRPLSVEGCCSSAVSRLRVSST